MPTLIMVGDKDEPAIEPSLFLKRKAPAAGLVMFPHRPVDNAPRVVRGALSTLG